MKPLLRCLVSVLAVAVPLAAQVERVVILKVDGLPEDLLERYIGQKHTVESAGSARAGRSRLPWLQYVFEQNGVWMENFYVRGLSISAPSWSLLDTGRHLEIRGNVEYDRYTLRPYDYLNFFPFYFGYAASKRVDMPGVELLDEQRVPMLIDRFPKDQRLQSFQLLQRGVRWTTLKSALTRSVSGKSPKALFDEWQVGFSMSDSLNRQTEHDLLQALKDPNIKYLDYYTGEYDHIAHLTNDGVSQFHTLEELDALVGRVWNGIATSPLADKTALILVSDHGMNTSENITSQGYNLVDWFSSAAGGSHHVLTNRHPETEFKLKGLDPFVSEVITPSKTSSYLAGQSDQYPTVMLDLDGNERASIGLRNNTLNQLQILLVELLQRRLPGNVRNETIAHFFQIRDQVRTPWKQDVDQLLTELTALDARIAGQQRLVDAQPKKWTEDQRAKGLDQDARRQLRRLQLWREERHDYADYAMKINRLLSLTPADFDPGKFKIADVIPPKSLGPSNSLWDLQHYTVGLAQDRTFQTVDYLKALSSLTVRNNVQQAVAPKPVDFIAVRIPEGIWLWRDEEHQALIQSREAELRYVPVKNLTATPSGEVTYDSAEWGPGFPLAIFEDPDFAIPSGDRAAWLSQWHDEREWLNAVHKTRYSNGIISLTEQLLDNPDPAPDPLRDRERRLRRTDLLVLANDHWNFNVRGFNPGGNHGSFFRTSTHSVLLMAGGKDTGLAHGLRIATPYDSLSFVPTILSLMGRSEPALPGPVIQELIR